MSMSSFVSWLDGSVGGQLTDDGDHGHVSTRDDQDAVLGAAGDELGQVIPASGEAFDDL
jgi:hypothetical protein